MPTMKPVKAWAVLVADEKCNRWRLSNGELIYPTKREAKEDAIESLGERVVRVEIREVEK